ncbi:MAG: hypothetical protein IKI71_01230 [Lachnospiraceae bacterium]|nr:hypothetical protein [Lachnospiraceae bacterium]
MKAYIIITIIYHFLYRILIGELVSMLDSKKDINNDSILLYVICFFLSYIPILFISETGMAPAIVSICIVGSLIDLAYVMIQRYNIPRVRALL